MWPSLHVSPVRLVLFPSAGLFQTFHLPVSFTAASWMRAVWRWAPERARRAPCLGAALPFVLCRKHVLHENEQPHLHIICWLSEIQLPFQSLGTADSLLQGPHRSVCRETLKCLITGKVLKAPCFLELCLWILLSPLTFSLKIPKKGGNVCT